MIQFNYETEFLLDNEEELAEWISDVIISEGFKEEEINYIFCDDDYHESCCWTMYLTRRY